MHTPTPAAPMPPFMHSMIGAATRIGVGRSTVYKLVDSGELRSVKVGRRRLISETAIQEYIARLEGVA